MFDYLNEAVNEELRAIFIAVPKTGTTSVRSQVRPRGNPMFRKAHLDICQVRDLLYPFELYRALGLCRTFPTTGVPTDAELRTEAERKFREFFKFSAVRNPWARAASLFARREGVQMSSRMNFRDFIAQHLNASDTCSHPTLHRNQSDWHIDADGTVLVDYVYRLEDFGSATGIIREMTGGRVNLTMKVENKNGGSSSERYQDLFDGETREMIARQFEKDIDLFKYVF
jgi:hypothetical protein